MIKQKKLIVNGNEIIINEGLTCPACGGKLNINFTIETIPYFGKTNFISYVCNDCYYKSIDLLPVEKKDPVNEELKIESKEDLYIKVVRGKDTTIEIKEIEMSLTPGENANVFITNIESILLRFKHALEFFMKDYDEKEKIVEKISLINDFLELKKPFTLRLRAPQGYGKILSDKAYSLTA